jgi:hypothetical protein
VSALVRARRVLPALLLLALALALAPLRARNLRVYVWIGPHGTEHFSDRPPPRAGVHVARRILRLPPPSSPAARRRARRSERRAARFLARLALTRARRERARAPRSTPVVRAPAPASERAPLWYLPFAPYPGVLPLYPRPPAPPSAALPPPDLAPSAGGYGICGYEIACPPPPPPPPASPAPQVPPGSFPSRPPPPSPPG